MRCSHRSDNQLCDSCQLHHCQPFALFEKQDFISFIAEDDTLQGPSKPISMFDTTEERTAFMMANAIFQLCLSDKSTSSASASSSLATGASGGSTLHSAQSASASIHHPSGLYQLVTMQYISNRIRLMKHRQCSPCRRVIPTTAQ
jgi:hypothetical protein